MRDLSRHNLKDDFATYRLMFVRLSLVGERKYYADDRSQIDGSIMFATLASSVCLDDETTPRTHVGRNIHVLFDTVGGDTLASL
jgi:hypothetical protein